MFNIFGLEIGILKFETFCNNEHVRNFARTLSFLNKISKFRNILLTPNLLIEFNIKSTFW